MASGGASERWQEIKPYEYSGHSVGALMVLLLRPLMLIYLHSIHSNSVIETLCLKARIIDVYSVYVGEIRR